MITRKLNEREKGTRYNKQVQKVIVMLRVKICALLFLAPSYRYGRWLLFLQVYLSCNIVYRLLFHPMMSRIFLLAFQFMESCSTCSNIYLIIQILNVYSQMMTTLKAKQFSRNIQSQICLTFRRLKSCRTVKFHKIRLLQFSIDSQVSDVIYMFAYEKNSLE